MNALSAFLLQLKLDTLLSSLHAKTEAGQGLNDSNRADEVKTQLLDEALGLSQSETEFL